MKVVNRVRDHPVLTFLVAFTIIQTIINIALAMGIVQTQDALRSLMNKLFPPIPTWQI